MALALPPDIGNSQQAQQATAFMRDQPWYQQLVSSWGLDPRGEAGTGNVRLSDDEQEALLNEARNRGIGISDRYHIDENGQIAEEDSHLWRNIAIGAGIGGAMLIPGVREAVLSGLMAGGHGAVSGLSAAGKGIGGAFGLGGGGTAAGLGPTTAESMAATSAALAPPASLASGGGMGFLSALKGGILPFLKGHGTDIAQLVGGIEKDRAQGLVQSAMLQQRQDELALARAKLALAAPGMEAANAATGDVLANAQDVTFSGLPDYIHVPNIQGGLRPSMFSSASRQLGQNMSAQALRNNQTGADVPDLTALPTSSGFDTFLQALGYGSGFMGILGKNNNTGGGGFLGGPGSPENMAATQAALEPPNSIAALDESIMPAPVGSPIDAASLGLSPNVLDMYKRPTPGLDY